MTKPSSITGQDPLAAINESLADTTQRDATAKAVADSGTAVHSAGKKAVELAKEGATTLKQAAGDAVDTVKTATAGTPGASAKVDTDDQKKKEEGGLLSGFTNGGGVGKVLGGLLGLGGAWFLGNIFGGGILSTVLSIALAIPLGVVGSDKIGDTINGWLGHPKNSLTPSTPPAFAQNKTPETALAQQTSVDKPALALTSDQLVAILADKESDHRFLKLAPSLDDPTRLEFRAVKPEESHTAKGVYDAQELLAAARAKAGTSVIGGIALVADNTGGYSVAALPRSTSAAQRG